MRAKEFAVEYREPKSKQAHRGGIDLEAWRDGLHFQINATSHGRDLGHVVFDVQFQGKDTILVAQDLMILPEYRGQGIAALMALGLKSREEGGVGSWLLGRAAELALKEGEESPDSLRATVVLSHLGRAFTALRYGII